VCCDILKNLRQEFFGDGGIEPALRLELMFINPILWRKRPKKSDRPAPKFGA
jgi:hypothetical protein